MAEPDIVERLRKAADHDQTTPIIWIRDDLLRMAAAEIERLRAELDGLAEFAADALAVDEEDQRGGWTRLGPESLPPQDGTPFEVRLDADPSRFIGSMLGSEVTVLVAEVGVRAGVGANMNAEKWLAANQGWWRLLPGGEPPT